MCQMWNECRNRTQIVDVLDIHTSFYFELPSTVIYLQLLQPLISKLFYALSSTDTGKSSGKVLLRQ